LVTYKDKPINGELDKTLFKSLPLKIA